MNETVQTASNSPVSGSVVEPDRVDTIQELPLTGRPLYDQTRLTAAELMTVKDEKLAAIRRAIQKGDYDSDAILEKSLERMLERLEKPENEQ